jgi:thymidylate synthase (FAD)
MRDKINVLDKGFVRLVDVMGNDSAIVQAARVSYGEGTKTINEDRGLIRYLLRHKHTSPLEMVEFKFHLKMPIYIARQHIRHRTANVNEMSARYSVMPDEFYLPAEIRGQSDKNKQCSEGVLDHTHFSAILAESSYDAYNEYEKAIEHGVSREMARMILPINLYTEMYWKIDLHNLLHYIRLRNHSHAQAEIQEYAKAMLDLITPHVPLTVEAFNDYVVNARTFSAQEMDILWTAIQDNIPIEYLIEMIQEKLSKGEAREFMEKFSV